MTVAETYGVACCLVTFFSVVIGVELMTRRLNSPYVVGLAVRGSLDLLAVSHIGRAIEIAYGERMSPGSALVLTTSALASTVVLVTMLGKSWRQAIEHREAEAALQAHAEDASVVREAVAEAMPDWLTKVAEVPDPVTATAQWPQRPAAES